MYDEFGQYTELIRCYCKMFVNRCQAYDSQPSRSFGAARNILSQNILCTSLILFYNCQHRMNKFSESTIFQPTGIKNTDSGTILAYFLWNYRVKTIFRQHSFGLIQLRLHIEILLKYIIILELMENLERFRRDFTNDFKFSMRQQPRPAFTISNDRNSWS